MGRNPTKAAGNRYFESRKRAAEHDERLTSREGAGDLLGVSWSSMADYERGLTRVPVDVVIRMSELYKDPALLNWFCCNECPICRDDLLATEMEDIRGIALRLIVDGDIDGIRSEIAEIAKDGIIDDGEKPRMQAAMKKLEAVGKIISELQIYCKAHLDGGGSCEYYETFDPEDHVMGLMEAKKNGLSGVPRLKELVEDADNIEKMIEDLYDALHEVETKYYEEDNDDE